MKRLIMLLALLACGVNVDAYEFRITKDYVSSSFKDSLKMNTIALLAEDWKQTRTNATNNWGYVHDRNRVNLPNGYAEVNPRYSRWGVVEKNKILGKYPTTKNVDLYFAGAVAAVLVADEVLPDWANMAVQVALIAVQGVVTTRNIDHIKHVGYNTDNFDTPMVRLTFKF